MAMYYGLQETPCITPMDPGAYSSMGTATSYPNPPFRPPFCTIDNAHQQLHHPDHQYLNYHQQQLALFQQQQQQFAGCDVQSISPAQLAPWNHTVPPCVPWFQSNSPFPAGTVPNCVGYTDNEQRLREFNLHCKRKGLHLDDAPTACKQYVSEEAMAFRMTQLNISGGNTSENRPPVEADWEKSYGSVCENFEDFELEQPEQQQITAPPPSSVVILAPELKKLETEPILPKSILERIQKPSMELVLWKPPSGVVDEVIRATLSDVNKKEKKVKGKEHVQRTNECEMDEDV